MVDPTLLHPLDHRLRTKVREQRVVYLDVSQACSVKFLDFFLVRDSDVRKVLVWAVEDETTRLAGQRKDETYRRFCRRPCCMHILRDEDDTIQARTL